MGFICDFELAHGCLLSFAPSFLGAQILRHLGLPTQVVTKAPPCDIWRVRGPPGELDDFGDDEPQVHADAIDEEYEEIGMRPFFDDEEELAKAA